MTTHTRKPGTSRRRIGREVRLQRFADGYVTNGGVAVRAARAAGVPDGPGLKVTACRLLKEAEARGLILHRMEGIRGKWEIEVGALIQKMEAVLDMDAPSRTEVRRDPAGKVQGTLEVFDALGAVRVLATMAGALNNRVVEMDRGVQLSRLLAAASEAARKKREARLAQDHPAPAASQNRDRAEGSVLETK